MLNGWTIVAVALGYLGLLFAVASYGDRMAETRPRNHARPIVYALTLGVYCTSWTFFGSVGLAANTGLDFLPIYIGPILMIAIGWPLFRRIADLAKRQNITSIADFIAARYGKNQGLGALVAIIAVLGVLPYISLQLKAVSTSLETLLADSSGLSSSLLHVPLVSDLALVVTITMAVFTVLFGTRHIDATEHQHGLMLAIAAESIVKILAFLIVGAYVTFFMFGTGELLEQAASSEAVTQLFTGGIDGSRWLTMTLLALVAIILLPRQFHVAIVENADPGDIKKASWLFPLYLIAINLFVVPVAVAGLLVFAPGSTDADTFVLALPMAADQPVVTLIAFIGGLSAATAMVIVATIALSIMVCNHLVVPFMLQRERLPADPREDMGRMLLNIRRGAIFAILGLAYCFYRMVGGSFPLASIGLLSFAAIAQFAPAFFGGLIWRRATAMGAIAGITVGFMLWAYTLLLPSFVDSGWISPALLSDGPFGLSMLRPRVLFGLETDPLTHGVLWSLVANMCAYAAVSLLTKPKPIERLQATAFVGSDLPGGAPALRLRRTQISVEDLMSTVARYLGKERTDRSFKEFADSRNMELDLEAEADSRLMRFSEHLLASAVGAASSRLVLALMIERRSPKRRSNVRLLDDASDAIQYNRDLLQSAIDHVQQGIAVFDKNLELICWNRQFRHLLHLPVEFGRIGAPLEEVLRKVAENVDPNSEDHGWIVSDRVHKLVVDHTAYQERFAHNGQVLEVRSDVMPDGGLVVTFADITERVMAADALQEANETLERRVSERTTELVDVNKELERAKAQAEAANIDKTRFLAAASHDIMQPLNAARLYATSLVDRASDDAERNLIGNVDASLESVEEILVTLLDISRLDAGALKPELSAFRLDELFAGLETEFAALAKEKELEFRIVPSSAIVCSDRRMLRRVLQNLISNAIKYTDHGKVIMGVRNRGERVSIQVLDTGCGIGEDEQRHIFREFKRLRKGESKGPGLGLGLSIVERICQVLGHAISVQSAPDAGSSFSVELPRAEASAVAPKMSRDNVSAAARLEGLHVLCVDNEANILDGMDALLRGWGCTTILAGSLAEARAAMIESRSSIDMIVADYHLDDEDGLALIETLRDDLSWSVPAALVTADRGQVLRDRAREADIIYMNKPVRPGALRAVLSRARVRAEAAE